MSQRDWIREDLDAFGLHTRISLLTGSILPAQSYYKAQKLRSMIRQQVLEALKRFDVLLFPVVTKCAQMIDGFQWSPGNYTASPPEYLLTRLFSLTGNPAISIPCGFSSEGLPIGLEIGGRPGEEETVLKVAHAYEQNTPWHAMRSPTV